MKDTAWLDIKLGRINLWDLEGKKRNPQKNENGKFLPVDIIPDRNLEVQNSWRSLRDARICKREKITEQADSTHGFVSSSFAICFYVVTRATGLLLTSWSHRYKTVKNNISNLIDKKHEQTVETDDFADHRFLCDISIPATDLTWYIKAYKGFILGPTEDKPFVGQNPIPPEIQIKEKEIGSWNLTIFLSSFDSLKINQKTNRFVSWVNHHLFFPSSSLLVKQNYWNMD